MRSVGIDLGAVSAIAAIDTGTSQIDWRVVRCELWKPSDKRDSTPQKIEDFYKWLRRQLFVIKPDIISVEEQIHQVNRGTIRVLSRYEGVAILAAKQSGAIVLNPGVSQSRSVVFGDGRLSKDDAWVWFRKLHPNVKLHAKNSGGSDEMDAYTHAIAAPTILERR
jgi:Holliday junction resolvasome RuvABC endonuclease subunit